MPNVSKPATLLYSMVHRSKRCSFQDDTNPETNCQNSVVQSHINELHVFNHLKLVTEVFHRKCLVDRKTKDWKNSQNNIDSDNDPHDDWIYFHHILLKSKHVDGCCQIHALPWYEHQNSAKTVNTFSINEHGCHLPACKFVADWKGSYFVGKSSSFQIERQMFMQPPVEVFYLTLPHSIDQTNPSGERYARDNFHSNQWFRVLYANPIFGAWHVAHRHRHIREDVFQLRWYFPFDLPSHTKTHITHKLKAKRRKIIEIEFRFLKKIQSKIADEEEEHKP